MKKNMTVAQGLKEIVRLNEKLVKLRGQVERYNCVEVGTRRPLSVSDCYAKAEALERGLIAVKGAVTAANGPVARQLAEMLLLRGKIQFVNHLKTEVPTSYGQRSDNLDVVVTFKDVERIDAELTDRLNALQDEVDEFNNSTRIEVDYDV